MARADRGAHRAAGREHHAAAPPIRNFSEGRRRKLYHARHRPEGSRIEKTTAIVADIERLVQETVPKQELEEVVSNTGLYFAMRPVLHPTRAITRPSCSSIWCPGIQAGPIRTLTRCEKTSQVTGSRNHPSNRRHHQRRVELRPACPNRHSDQGTVLGSHSSGVAEHIRQEVAQVANTTDVRIKQGKSYPELT